jgi:uncharacterized protein involved in outer membrane biogenesis
MARNMVIGFAALLAVTLVLLLTVDLGRFKGTVESLVSDTLGREFSIGGRFQVHLGRQIYILAEDVQLSDADWGSGDPFVRVGRFESTIDAWSIFSAPIRVEKLRIDNVRVSLRRNESGQDNWDMLPADDAEDDQPQERLTLPALLADALIADLVLTYDAPQRAQPLTITATELRVVQTDTDVLQIDLSGGINETPMALMARAGAIENLVDFRNVEFNVSGSLGEIRFDGEAAVDDVLLPRRPVARITLRGPNAEYLTDILRQQRVTTGPLDLTATIAPVGKKMQLVVNGKFGEFELDASGQFVDLQELQEADLRIAASGPDSSVVARLFGNDAVPPDPFSIVGNLHRSGKSVSIDDTRVTVGKSQFSIGGRFENFPYTRGAQMTLHVDGPDFGRFNRLLGLPGKLTGPFTLDAGLMPLADGRASINLNAVAQDVRLGIAADVSERPDFVGTRAKITIAGPNVQTLTTVLGLERAPADPFELTLVVERGAESYVLQDVQAVMGEDGEYNVQIEGEITPSADFVGSKVSLRGKGKSLGLLMGVAGIEGMPDLPFEVGATAQRQETGILIENGTARIGDDHVKLDGLIANKPLQGDTNITLAARGPDLKASLNRFGTDFSHLPAGAFDVAGEIRNQGAHFAVQNLRATLAGAQLAVDGRLGRPPELEGTKLTVKISGSDLSRLLPDEQKFSALNKPFGVSAEVSVRDQELSLNEVAAFVDEAKLDADVNFRLSPLFGNGEFSVNASSPDLFRLTPRMEEISVLEKAPLKLQSQGKWTDKLWMLDALSLQLGKGTLVTSGTVDGSPNFERTDLRSTLNIASMRNLSVLAGRDLPDEPAHLKLHLVGSNNAMELKEFFGTFGDSDISGEFTLRSGDVKNIDFGLRSKRLNLVPFLPKLTEEDKPKKDAEANNPKTDRVIPDTVIPMDELREFRVSANIDVAELILRQRTLRDVVAVGAIKDGALKLTKFNIRSSRDEVLTGTVDLHPGESGAEMLLSIHGDALAMGLPAVTEKEMQALPRYDADAVMHATGVTVREMAGSLNGYVRIVAGPGDIRTGALAFFTNDFASEVLNTVNPFVKSNPYTHYECAAILLRMKDGVAEGEPAAVLQSNRLRIFANAMVDLKSEKLNVTVNTVPTKGLGLSFSDLINPYTMIGGTLAHPSLTLDPDGALISGGAAVATGGLSILAKRFKDRFLSEKDACSAAVNEVDPAFQALKLTYFPEPPEVNLQ